MSSVRDDSLPSIALPVGREDRDHLWEKTKLAFAEVTGNSFTTPLIVSILIIPVVLIAQLFHQPIPDLR